VNAIAVPKSRALNWLEGVTLSAIFQGLPTFAGAVLLLKLAGAHEIVGDPAIFVALASLFRGLMMPWLAPKFPKLFSNSSEPLFLDASLSFSEELAQWPVQPKTSLQLVTTVMMLSLLAVGLVSVG
jgi:hypothetical protein